MFMKNKIVGNEVEFEVAILSGAVEVLDEILSLQLFRIYGTGENRNILFETRYYQKYFYLNLIDFISTIDNTFKIDDEDCSLLSGLNQVADSPNLGTKEDIQSLNKYAKEFEDWLRHETAVEVWMPDINKDVKLFLSRYEMVKICGNITKHGTTRLGRTAIDIAKIFERSDIEITYDEAILSLENFYEQFHDDILNYHASSIVEMLLNIRTAIYDYLKPVYQDCYRFVDEMRGIIRYTYEIPEMIKSEVVRKMFWDLMNDIRSNREIPELKVTQSLKGKY